MALNSFRGDAEPRSKIIRLQKPNNVIGVKPTIRVNNKSIRFEDWNAATIANAINASGLAELAELEAVATATSDVDITGPLDADFDVRYDQTPTATVTNIAGRNPLAQISRIAFNGASGGTYTITMNGETTSAITFGDIAEARTAMAALASFASTDFTLTESGAAYVLEFKGAYIGSVVTVSVNGGGLTNVVGTVATTKTARSKLSRYDVFQLAMAPSNSAVIDIDGNTDRIFSDDSLATVREKIQALATGGKLINVYGGQITTGVAGSVWVVEFEGYSTASRPVPFAVVSSTIANGAEIQPIYDVITSPKSEHIMFDFSEAVGPLVITADGVEVTIAKADSAATIVGKLNAASQYGEWTAVTSAAFTHGGTIGTVHAPYIRMMRWTRTDLYDVADIPDSYLQSVSGTGRMKVIANGGTDVGGAKFSLYRTPNTISNGTWTLEFEEGTTDNIDWNASAGTVQTAIAAVVAGSTCAAGTGTAADPWKIQIGSGSTDADQTPIVETAFTGQGSALATISRSRDLGLSATAIVVVSTRAVSGNFVLFYGTEGPVAFAAGIDAVDFATTLQSFASLADEEDIAVDFDEPSGTYEISFTGNLALRTVQEFEVNDELHTLATADDETNTTVIQLATGPRNFGEPLNWTAGRLPEHNDNLMLDSASDDIVYSLRHYMAVTADNTTDRLDAVGGHDFLANQKVRLFGDDLPYPLVANFDYFVISPDYSRGTFAVSETANGAMINITTNGTGTMFVGVRVKTLKVTSAFARKIGLEESNAAGFREYRPRYLCLGVIDTVYIGEGAGQGSGLIRLNFGDSGPVVRVVSTGSPSEVGFPAVNILAQSEELRFATMEGVAGVAAGDDEEATIADAGLHGGETQFGTVTILRDLLKSNGAMTARELHVVGVVREN